MNPLLTRPWSGLLAQSTQIRWERPPSGTLQRGLLWIRWPGAVLVVASILAAVIVVLALRARMQRRRNG